MRPFLSVLVVLGCLAPLPAEANPYAAYVAKYLGEYLLGKYLDEVWDAASGVPDVKELDLRLRAFENALIQVDAQLSGRIAELRRQIAKRPTHDEVRQVVEQVLSELEARIAELERRADRIEQKIAQFEEVFGIVTVVPPAPLLRSSIEAGNPAVHPADGRMGPAAVRVRDQSAEAPRIAADAPGRPSRRPHGVADG